MFKQLVFYRCLLCRRVVSPWDLDKYKGCGKCGHGRVSPTNLTLHEELIQFFKHPDLWNWDKVKLPRFAQEVDKIEKKEKKDV